MPKAESRTKRSTLLENRIATQHLSNEKNCMLFARQADLVTPNLTDLGSMAPDLLCKHYNTLHARNRRNR